MFANNGGTVDNDGDYVGNNSPSSSTIYIDNGYAGNVYGGKADSGEIINNEIFISGGTITGNVYSGKVTSGGSVKNNYISIDNSTILGAVSHGEANIVSNNEININDSTIGSIDKVFYFANGNSEVSENIINITGGTIIGKEIRVAISQFGNITGNELNISGGKIIGSVRLGTTFLGAVTDNIIKISGTADLVDAELIATPAVNVFHSNNNLIIDGWSGSNGSGNYSVKELQNFDNIEFKNIKGNTGLMSDTVTRMDDTQLILSSVDVTNLSNATNHTFGTITLSKTITDAINDFPNKIDTTDLNGWNFNDNETSGIYAGYIANATATTNNNTITITGDIEKSVLTGVFIDESGNKHYKGSSTPDDTTDDTTTLTIGNGFDTKVATVAGVYAADKTDGTAQNAEKGVVNISGDNITYDGIVYAGYSESGSASGNIINVEAGTNAKNMTLSGTYNTGSDNVLNLAGSATFKAIYKFNAINFDKIDWINGGTVLNITNNTEEKALANTNINLKSLNFAGGAELNTGESMTIISNNDLGKDLGIGTGTGKIDALSNFTAGVAIEGTGTAEVASDGNSVKYTLTEVKHLDQIDLVAENRAVAAAFVNQGTDLISDSLDTISRDSNYGVKTFAAVHGNRSKYDVNSDIKINGWSVIAGVGNADKFDNGSEFSWGVFYENGSGNYRTYNEFNNEFFRGDGNLVYNGGGIAARYTNKNGVYTEGSLRAGMLKSDMDNALRDGAGNFYGYESESAYYGAHIGVGKIISLSDSSDLDIYGKFFHTYTEGDSFKVANDEFEFDSINSDRLRIGARITSNKENKFSTYYGLAYEYEFNGDADMTAQGLKAPTQSLQGSSIMAEVGFNYQPTPDSPWSFDLNMRGYAGERQGGSFNVQATYTF